MFLLTRPGLPCNAATKSLLQNLASVSVTQPVAAKEDEGIWPSPIAKWFSFQFLVLTKDDRDTVLGPVFHPASVEEFI